MLWECTPEGCSKDRGKVILFPYARFTFHDSRVPAMSRLLVCPPDYFAIEYEINPWMRRVNAVNSDQAVRQWHRLMQVLEEDVGAALGKEAQDGKPGENETLVF